MEHLEIINKILEVIKNENDINKEGRLKKALIELEKVKEKTNENIIKSEEILSLLANNLPATKSDPIKAAIFQIILDDCKKSVNIEQEKLKVIEVKWCSLGGVESGEEVFCKQINLISKSFECESTEKSGEVVFCKKNNSISKSFEHEETNILIRTDSHLIKEMLEVLGVTDGDNV